jgi:class 3 adenylate cyclase
MERRHAATLVADVAGCNRAMEAGEEATLTSLNAYRQEIDGLIAYHDGRMFNSAGVYVNCPCFRLVEAAVWREPGRQSQDVSYPCFRLPFNDRQSCWAHMVLGRIP